MNPMELIDKRLKEMGLIYADFAKRIKESPQVINNWKKRGRIPSNKIKKVANALNLGVNELLPGTLEIATILKIGVGEERLSYIQSEKRLLKAWSKLTPEVRAHFIAIMEICEKKDIPIRERS